MHIRPFQFKRSLVKSPDDIIDVVESIDNKDDARLFIISLANRLTYGDTTHEHIYHACYLVLNLSQGSNPHIIDGVQSVW